MKITGITMITDPEYRQDLWAEAVRQSLTLCDQVVIVYGKKSDKKLILKEFENDERIGMYYMHWPQPEWSYSELPLHLNIGLNIARKNGADWIYKFDTDYFIHEKDVAYIRGEIALAASQGKWVGLIEKRQFFLADRCYEKGKMPLLINAKKPIWYGFDESRYTDLCQPIHYDGEKMTTLKNDDRPVPSGVQISDDLKFKTSGIFYNYDYTFKTKERARDLLYHFDRSHAKFWGRGYSGLLYDEITHDTAFNDYMQILKSRVKKCTKNIKVDEHPVYIQDAVKNITKEQMGYDLWGLKAKL